MATADDVTTELMGTNLPANHHDVVVGEGGPAPFTVRTVQSKVTEALKEVTKWLPGRSVDRLLGQEDSPDTTLGHAIRAASWGYHNYRAIKALSQQIADLQTERLAQMGDAASVAAIKAKADAGDKSAQTVYAYLTEAE